MTYLKNGKESSIKNTLLHIAFVFLASVLVCVSDASAQYKYWLHGYTGPENYWNRHKDKFGTPSVNLNYTTGNNSISTIALNKVNSIASGSILIGHSMGGLVARKIDIDNPSKGIKGIITVGTPNRGAEVIKSGRNNKHKTLLSNIYRRINAVIYSGPLTIIGAGAISPVILVVKVGIDNLVEQAVSDLVNTNAASDMIPNRYFLNSLNSKRPNAPLITIYGTEYSWAPYRLAGSFLATKGEPDFQHDDEYIVRYVREAIGHLDNIYNFLQANPGCYNFLQANPGWNYLFWHLQSRAKSLSNYIKYTFETEWNGIIGSYRWRTERVRERRWVNDTPHGVYSSKNYRIEDRINNRNRRLPSSGRWEYYWRTVTYKHSTPNDGLIGSYHAQSNWQKTSFRADGANHMEMRNNKATYDALDKSFRYLKSKR